MRKLKNNKRPTYGPPYVKYKCKKAFQLKELGENKYLVVNKNSLWEIALPQIDKENIRLEQHKIKNKIKVVTRWLELSKEELEEYFEEVKQWKDL